MKNTIKRFVNRVNLFGAILMIGLWLFLLFNAATTLETLGKVLGPGIAVVSFGLAVSIVDFAGLARVFVPFVERDHEILSRLLLAIWLAAAVADMILTAWWVDMRIANNTEMVSGIFGARLTVYFPWILAFAEFCIRIPLVVLASGFFDLLFRTGKVKLVPQRKTSKAQVRVGAS